MPLNNNEFPGAISPNYGGLCTISCLLFDIFKAGMVPWYLVNGPFQISKL